MAGDEMRLLEESAIDWEQRHADEFRRERKAESEFVCDSGIKVNRLYTPLDLARKGFEYLKDLGMPGEYPYTRGIAATGYRGQTWRVSQYSGHPLPEETNKLWKSAIRSGLNTVYIAYDLPTQLGYDPDAPAAAGEVGRVGVSLASLRDWEVAFDGISLDGMYVSQVANAMGAIAIANHVALAQAQGVPLANLRGSCQNEPIKDYIVRGTYIYPAAPAVRLVLDALEYCYQHIPEYRPLQICSAHYSENQSTPVHDAAFALATGFYYLQGAVDRGLDIDKVAPHVEFLNGHEHYGFFQEIAKMRAIRKVYSRTLRDRLKAKTPEAQMCRIYSAQGGNSLQRAQYLNNIARSGIAAVVGALGGAETIDLRGYDEQFGIPTKEALTTSIQVQRVVAEETGITDTVDPLAGSYFVETLTCEFEERIMQEIDAIEKHGGVLQCVENGYMKRAVAQDAFRWQKAFERGDVKRVGTNCWTTQEDARPTTVYRASPDVERKRIDAVLSLRQSRDNRKVKNALDEVKAIAVLDGGGDNNLMPPILEAVKSYCTVGEICDCLREVWGEFKQPAIVI